MTSMNINTFFSFIGLKDYMIKQINHQIYLKFRIDLISVKIFLKVKIHIFNFFYFWVYFPTFLHGAILLKRSIKSKMAITIELFQKNGTEIYHVVFLSSFSSIGVHNGRLLLRLLLSPLCHVPAVTWTRLHTC